MRTVFRTWKCVILIGAVIAFAGCSAFSEKLPSEPTNAELLPNTSFENVEVVDGIVMPVGWRAQQHHTESTPPPLANVFEIDDQIARTGNQSIKLPPGGGSSHVGVHHSLNVEGGKTYKFTVWYRSVPGIDWDTREGLHQQPQYLTVRLLAFKTEADNQTSSNRLNWTTDWTVETGSGTEARKRADNDQSINLYTTRRGLQDGEWYPLEYTFTLPSNAASIQIALSNRYGRKASSSNSYNEDAIVWYDDVSLVKVD